MYKITADQVHKLFQPTDHFQDEQYQIDFEIASEQFISVMINCDCAIIVSTGVWSPFEVKQKKYLGNMSSPEWPARRRKLYEWIAKQINAHAEGASDEDVVVYKIKRQPIRVVKSLKRNNTTKVVGRR